MNKYYIRHIDVVNKLISILVSTEDGLYLKEYTPYDEEYPYSGICVYKAYIDALDDYNRIEKKCVAFGEYLSEEEWRETLRQVRNLPYYGFHLDEIKEKHSKITEYDYGFPYVY